MPIILRKTIAEIFRARVEATPNFVGFRYRCPVKADWKVLTYQGFYERCRLLSYGLMSLGVSPGDRVGILSRTRVDWSLCDMAILGARAVSVPLYPSLTAGEAVEVLDHAEVTLLILEDGEQLGKILDSRARDPHCLPKLKNVILIDPAGMKLAVNRSRNIQEVLTLQALIELGRREEGRAPLRFDGNLAQVAPGDWLTLSYTTGTTGAPKAVPLTHENFVSVIEDCVARMSGKLTSEAESCVSFLPFSHVLGRLESLIVHSVGIHQVFADDLEQLPGLMKEFHPTLLFAVPRIFEKAYGMIQIQLSQQSERRKKLFSWAQGVGMECYQRARGRKKIPLLLQARYRLANKLVFHRIADRFGGKLRYAISGGAPLNATIGEFFEVCGIHILEGYGLTETAAPVTLSDPACPRFGSVGKPLDEVTIRIAEDGEILIKSRKVFSGYYKDASLTESALKGGWFHTGDIGYIDDEGYLYITDRKKDLIITSGGKTIAPQKIEKLAKAQNPISEIVVHGDHRHYLTALITLHREEVFQFANDHRILFSEYSELIKQPRIRAWVEKAVEGVNLQLARYETIKKFIILPGDFTVDSGELTPSLKVKRRVVEARYRDELESLYRLDPGGQIG